VKNIDINLGILAVISGRNIPWSEKSDVYRAKITSNDPCWTNVIWSVWLSSRKPSSRVHKWNVITSFVFTYLSRYV